MWRYSAYGLVIASEMVLPELEPGTGEPDLVIRLGSIGETHWEPTVWDREYAMTPTRRCLRIPQYASFALVEGRELIVEPDPAFAPEYWNSLILGPAIAFVLHARGLLVLHGSAVALDGTAVAFLGNSGSGKSTLAAMMHAHGLPLVTDDHVAVDFSAAPDLRVHPGFPHLRLYPESAVAAGVNPSALPRVDADADKRGLRLDREFIREPLPPRVFYVLDDGPQIAIQPLASSAALIELVRYSLLTYLLPAMQAGAQHLEQCALIARTWPVRRLTRPRDLSALLDLAERVCADAASISNAPPDNRRI